MLTAAANAVSQGVPPWLVYLGGVVLGPLITVLMLWLRRLLKVDDETPEAAPTPESPVTTQGSASPTPPPPDPEIALIAETLRGYRDELREARAAMIAAEERHRREMAAAERRHREAIAEVRAALEDRETTIRRLEAMVDVLTGRRSQPPPST